MKKLYNAPETLIISLVAADILTVSGVADDEGDAEEDIF